MKKIIFRILLVIIIIAAGYGGYRLFSANYHTGSGQIATAKVVRGDVVIRTFARGELQAVRSISLTAPNLAGTVQITKLAPLGALAKEKDLIVEFDDSEVESRLEERQLDLEQTDEQIKKTQADLAISQNQDQVDLLRARYDVRRAELNVQLNPVISAIDAKKNLLTLDEAKRKLKQLESDIQSRLEQAESQLVVLREYRNRAVFEVEREKQRLGQTKLLTPMTGLVAIKQNRNTGTYFPGMQLPDFREGDQIYPGTLVADVLDLSEVEVVAKIGELERANLREDQEVLISLDSIPNRRFKGRIKSMSGTASANVYSGDPSKKFDVTFSIGMEELMATLGATPDQIRKVMETAERNRKKPVLSAQPPDMMAAMLRLSKAQQSMPAAPALSQPGQAGSAAPNQQEKFLEAMKHALGGRNVQDLTPEERQKFADKMKNILGVSGAGQAHTDRYAKSAGARSATPPPGVGGKSRAGIMQLSTTGGQQFSEKELADAKLPPPPEESNRLEVLLRPGLLADVEIYVEKLTNVVHVPNQAVFEKDGKPLVYLKTGNRFEERYITPSKRSESFLVIASGLQGGETVALADPYAKKGDKKEKQPSGGPAGNSGKGGK